MTQPLHPAQPAPMGIPLDELIERAVKHAQYETLSRMAKALDECWHTDRDEIDDVIRTVAREYGLPAPAALKDGR